MSNYVFSILIYLFLTPIYAATPVSSLVAKVGDQSITSREIKIHSVLNQANSAKEVIIEIPSVDSKVFQQAVRQLISQIAVYKESQVFDDESKADWKEELKLAQSRVMANIKKQKNFTAWDQLEVNLGEVEEALKIQTKASRFLKFKRDSAMIDVTDEEVLSYFKANQAKFSGGGFSSYRESIKNFLVQKRADERLQGWFTVLQKKYRVKVY